jgi:hypothetical protein
LEESGLDIYCFDPNTYSSLDGGSLREFILDKDDMAKGKEQYDDDGCVKVDEPPPPRFSKAW